jgi:hypothetical protein
MSNQGGYNMPPSASKNAMPYQGRVPNGVPQGYHYEYNTWNSAPNLGYQDGQNLVIHECIQKAIEQGRIGLEKNKKTMDIEGHTFPQNMVAVALPKGKTKVLTSNNAREVGTVDLESQMTAEEYREVKIRRDRQKSRFK